jgi:hypothetical protein
MILPISLPVLGQPWGWSAMGEVEPMGFVDRCAVAHGTGPRVVAMPSSGQVDVPVFNFCRIDLDPQAPIDNVVPIPRICGQSQSRLMLCMKLLKRVLDTKVQRMFRCAFDFGNF